MSKASGGNAKSPKGNQPKRQRYVTTQRGFRRRVRDLEKHLAKHPDDEQAQAALILARDMVARGGK